MQIALSIAFTFAIVFLGLLLLCAALVLLLPAFRREIEVFALVVMLFPAANDLLGFSDPFAKLMVFFVVTYLIIGVFNGFVLDNWRLRTRGGTCHRFVTPLAPDAVWEALVPGEGPLEAYWQPNLTEQRPVPGHPDQIEQQFALGDGLFLHRKVRFVEKQRPYRCHYEAVGDVSHRNADVNAHELDLTIEARPDGGSTVIWKEHSHVMRPRSALCIWFDDDVGDTVDHLRAKMGGGQDWSMLGRAYRFIEKRA